MEYELGRVDGREAAVELLVLEEPAEPLEPVQPAVLKGFKKAQPAEIEPAAPRQRQDRDAQYRCVTAAPVSRTAGAERLGRLLHGMCS